MLTVKHPIFWRELPFARILLPFLLGLISYYYGFIPDRFHPAYLLLFISILQIISSGKYRNLIHFFCFCFLFLIGHQIGAYGDPIKDTDHYLHYSEDASGFSGNIYSIQEKETTTHLYVELNNQYFEKGIKKVSGKILIYLRDTNPDINLNDHIFFQKELNIPPTPQNPYSFNYPAWLALQHIFRVTTLKTGDYTIKRSEESHSFSNYIHDFRENLISVFRKHFSDPVHFQLASAMVLGYREEMDRTTRDQFSKAGLMHILAVSGLHIGIVYTLLFFIFHKKPGGYISLIIILTGVWFFVLITGAPPSAVRAGFLFSVIQMGKTIRRGTSIYNSLAAAAFCLLLYQPNWLFDIGFQLSFFAVWGIVYFQPKIVALFSPENRFLNYCWQITSVSIAAQLVTSPISLYYFQQIPVYFWLSGLIGIPLAPIILIGGLALLLMDTIWHSGSAFIGLILDWVVGLLQSTTELIAELPGSRMGQEIYISFLEMILLYLLLLLLIALIETRHRNWLRLLIMSCLLFYAGRLMIRTNPPTMLTFYADRSGTQVDHFSNRRGICIQDSRIAEENTFATKGWRVRQGIRTDQISAYHTEDSLSLPFLMAYHDFYKFRGIGWRWIDSEKSPWSDVTDFPTDIWLISGRTTWPPERPVPHIPRLLIMDLSISRAQAERWKIWADTSGITYINMYEKGAVWVRKETETWHVYCQNESDNPIMKMGESK